MSFELISRRKVSFPLANIKRPVSRTKRNTFLKFTKQHVHIYIYINDSTRIIFVIWTELDELKKTVNLWKCIFSAGRHKRACSTYGVVVGSRPNCNLRAFLCFPILTTGAVVTTCCGVVDLSAGPASHITRCGQSTCCEPPRADRIHYIRAPDVLVITRVPRYSSLANRGAGPVGRHDVILL